MIGESGENPEGGDRIGRRDLQIAIDVTHLIRRKAGGKISALMGSGLPARIPCIRDQPVTIGIQQNQI